MATIFTKIRTGEIPGHILDDSGACFALLDVHPKQVGHTLVIPYLEESYVFDLPSDVYHELWEYARQVATTLKQVTGKEKIAVVVEGMQVPHVHIHLIPIDGEHQLHGPEVAVTEPQMRQLVDDYQRHRE